MGEYISGEADLSLIKPSFTSSPSEESPRVQSTLKTLNLETHIEGGYFVQTDAAPTSIPSPYSNQPLSEHTVSLVGGPREGLEPAMRRLSTTIFYYLTPKRPLGTFHCNRSRIIHTLHRGRGRYVLIHPDGKVESFVVGQDIEKGEKLQWIVEGGVWKASYLLEETDGKESGGLLISETVVPGFEYIDHQFLSQEQFKKTVSDDKAAHLQWLVRKEPEEKAE